MYLEFHYTIIVFKMPEILKLEEFPSEMMI